MTPEPPAVKPDNDTLLGTYLATLQAKTRELARLEFSLAYHPDQTETRKPSELRKSIIENWEKLRKDLWDLLDLRLKPFCQVAEKGVYHEHSTSISTGPRCLRWNMRKIKKLADKHRRKHPDFKFLESWDNENKKPKSQPREP